MDASPGAKGQSWYPVLVPRAVWVPVDWAPRAVLAQQGRRGASPVAPGLDSLGREGMEEMERREGRQ